MLSNAWQGSLPAILFHLALWSRYFGRGLLGSWPQTEWQLVDFGRRLAVQRETDAALHIPEPAMLSGTWDRTPYAMEATILRPLLWFGLLEHRSEKISGDQFGELHF